MKLTVRQSSSHTRAIDPLQPVLITNPSTSMAHISTPRLEVRRHASSPAHSDEAHADLRAQRRRVDVATASPQRHPSLLGLSHFFQNDTAVDASGIHTQPWQKCVGWILKLAEQELLLLVE